MKLTIACLLITTLYACDMPEHYFSEALTCEKATKQIDYNSLKYSIEKVLPILKSSQPKDYRYYFQTFINEVTGKYIMLVNFRNHSICMDVQITIDNLGKLTGMKKTNGKTYPNELYDLQWKIEMRNGNPEVIFIDMHDIID